MQTQLGELQVQRRALYWTKTLGYWYRIGLIGLILQFNYLCAIYEQRTTTTFYRIVQFFKKPRSQRSSETKVSGLANYQTNLALFTALLYSFSKQTSELVANVQTIVAMIFVLFTKMFNNTSVLANAETNYLVLFTALLYSFSKHPRSQRSFATNVAIFNISLEAKYLIVGFSWVHQKMFNFLYNKNESLISYTSIVITNNIETNAMIIAQL